MIFFFSQRSKGGLDRKAFGRGENFHWAPKQIPSCNGRQQNQKRRKPSNNRCAAQPFSATSLFDVLGTDSAL
jgi:hypothetical protein